MTLATARTASLDTLLDADSAIGRELSQPGMFSDANAARCRELLTVRRIVRAELEFRHALAADDAALPLPASTWDELIEAARLQP